MFSATNPISLDQLANEKMFFIVSFSANRFANRLYANFSVKYRFFIADRIEGIYLKIISKPTSLILGLIENANSDLLLPGWRRDRRL